MTYHAFLSDMYTLDLDKFLHVRNHVYRSLSTLKVNTLFGVKVH